ncbi:MAG: fasciclin protein [Mucilaginibacter sp.]|nr:fasciclin protein [Mucilaginibacter sp.]
MKKILLLSFALIYGTAVFAQKAAISINTLTIGPMKPMAGDGMLPTNNIVQNLELSKDLSAFYNFAKIANLLDTYNTKGPITAFIPVNEAFGNLPVDKLDSLNKPSHVWELTEILTYHAIAGSLSAKDIQKQIIEHKGIATFTTLNGAKLTAKIDANRNIVLEDENGGQSIISRFDIKQNNGILHIVNKVLLPKTRTI